jgi:nuclear pore complex protein Nup155
MFQYYNSCSGVFKELVEWCLVITTEEEAFLCALARPDGSTQAPLRLVRTRFCIPTDWVAFLSVTATKDGRIFLGGQDGNLYEMDYDSLVGMNPTTSVPRNPLDPKYMSTEQQLDAFYDGTKKLPQVLYDDSRDTVADRVIGSGKRILSHVVPFAERPNKCRKLNHSQSNVAAAILPDFVRNSFSAFASIFGGSATTTGGGPIVQMVVDDERQVLYTLSSRGWICTLDVANGKVELKSVVDIGKTARSYLEAVSRGRSYPPSSSSSREGIISFPGGSTAAQKAVGGMDGARSILKVADASSGRGRRGGASRATAPSVLTPVSLHVIPRGESSRLTLMAVTAGGLRYYLSSLTPNVISSGQSLAYFGASRRSDPLAPHTRLSFCHVRAPPSLYNLGSALTSSGNVDDGRVPELASAVDKLARVDASWYRMGVFLVAFKQPDSSSSSNERSKIVGNVIVTSCADSRARLFVKKNTNTELSSNGDSDTSTITTYVTPGGLAEALGLPMARSYGSSAGESMLSSVLAGGRVWEMKSASEQNSPLMQLALNSKTPSDGELGIGMVPAYFPKSTSRSSQSTSADGSRTKSAVSSPANQSVSSLAVTLFTNLLLSRPLRYGIEVPRTLTIESAGASANRSLNQPIYRLSKRDGLKGFSLTAGEESSSSRSNTTRSTSISPRLSPWLLQPATVPLNPLALQHLVPVNKSILALNAGGLHYFGVRSLLKSLADTISAAGVNVSSDKAVTEFFTSYGYKEGCAMCLMLAIGLGPAGADANLKEKAITAALARAFSPKLTHVSEDSTTTAAPASNDPLIPSGYEFKPSSLCESVGIVISRLLRPIWNKAAVVVTEGRIIKRVGASQSRTTPAKVELLLDDATLGSIRQSLFALKDLMRSKLSRAIETVPGQAGKSDAMDIDENLSPGHGHLLTRALEYHTHTRGSGGGGQHLRPAEAEEIARLTEERILHSHYRLLSRAVQLLSLLFHLKRAQEIPELPEVEWGLLHGITISQLVQSRDGQDRMESLLNNLITSTSTTTQSVAPSAETNQLANQLAEQCYHFFSPGSRFAYIGFRYANEALACPPNSSRRGVRVNDAVKYLKQAASHWFSPSLITGRILHNKDKESYNEIADRAFRYDSPLAKAVNLLMRLGETAGVVEICLLAAANFTGKRASLVAASDSALLDPTTSQLLPWEKGLYHKRNPSSASSQTGTGGESTASNSAAIGVTVTAKDAIDTCYALIFANLSKLLHSSDMQMASEMASFCAGSTDTDFLHVFFAYLLENNHKDTLLRINSPDLEKWLATQTSEPELLWKYYVTQGRHADAGEVAWKRAVDMNIQLHLDERVECLVRALDSYNNAADGLSVQRQWSTPGKNMAPKTQDEFRRSATQVKETLDVARLQSRVLHSINVSKPDLPEEDIKKLNYSLISVSDLYNDYAFPMDMVDVCLLVLFTCGHDDPTHIQQLWKTLICEEVLPCATRSEQAYRFLQTLTEGSLAETAKIKLLGGGASAEENDSLFESGNWMRKLEGRIVPLGREIYGKGADYVFPVDFIVSCLEELQRAYAAAVPKDVATESQSFPFRVLVDVGVPYMVALNAYDSIIGTENHTLMGGVDQQRRLEHMANLVVILESWVREAQATLFGARNEALDELGNSMASGSLLSRIDSIKAQLHSLPGPTAEIESRLVAVEEAIKQRIN